jgi:hypothetical protein
MHLDACEFNSPESQCHQASTTFNGLNLGIATLDYVLHAVGSSSELNELSSASDTVLASNNARTRMAPSCTTDILW